MVVRYALVGLAVAGLSRPAAAVETISASRTQIESEGASAETADGVRLPKRAAPAPKTASILPPSRPGDLIVQQSAAPSPKSAYTSLMPGSAPLVPATGFTLVTIAPPARPAESSASVAVTPPLRPVDPAQADAFHAAIAELAPTSGRFSEILPPVRPSFAWDSEPATSAAIEAAPPAQISPPAPQPSVLTSLFGSFPSTPAAAPAATVVRSGHGGIDALIATHAKLNGVPEDLVHRVVIRESKYNPRAVGRGGALGLMQIKHATARSLGYTGPSSGLLDANTNLTYAVKYLAGAYQAAGGDYRRAVGYYARGYYYAAKSQRVIHVASRRSLREAEARAPDGTLLAQTSTR
jgi:soluble lytic murein transglycosylase-like protein